MHNSFNFYVIKGGLIIFFLFLFRYQSFHQSTQFFCDDRKFQKGSTDIRFLFFQGGISKPFQRPSKINLVIDVSCNENIRIELIKLIYHTIFLIVIILNYIFFLSKVFLIYFYIKLKIWIFVTQLKIIS